MSRRPLEGLRVLDLGTRIAAPFCAGLLGEQGAEVIKIEQPGGGDPLRELGPFVDTDDGPYSLYWAVEGRGYQAAVHFVAFVALEALMTTRSYYSRLCCSLVSTFPR